MNKLQPVTYAQVDLKAIEHNLKQIRKLALRNKFDLPFRPKKVSSSQVLAVIKADAYGHGIKEIGLLLNRLGVGFFAVSDLNEGIVLRSLNIKKPILLLESPLPFQAKEIVDHSLIPTVCTLELAASLNHYAKKIRRNIDIHVKVDTGMGRLGVWHEEAFDFIMKVSRLRRIRIMGIYTHFPVADSDKKFTQRQIGHLYRLVRRLDTQGPIIPYIHAANSMGLAGYKTHILNLVRPGLMLYGLYPDPKIKKAIHLKPALSIKSKIIFLKRIEKGRSISYGRTFISKKGMTVATIPVGYNDGYMRAMSNKSYVLVNGARCSVLGRVTMDQIVIDISRLKNPKVGMPVVILGRQKNEEITADELAHHAGTINYEIVCSFGNRIPRVYQV